MNKEKAIKEFEKKYNTTWKEIKSSDKSLAFRKPAKIKTIWQEKQYPYNILTCVYNLNTDKFEFYNNNCYLYEFNCSYIKIQKELMLFQDMKNIIKEFY